MGCINASHAIWRPAQIKLINICFAHFKNKRALFGVGMPTKSLLIELKCFLVSIRQFLDLASLGTSMLLELPSLRRIRPQKQRRTARNQFSGAI